MILIKLIKIIVQFLKLKNLLNYGFQNNIFKKILIYMSIHYNT